MNKQAYLQGFITVCIQRSMTKEALPMSVLKNMARIRRMPFGGKAIASFGDHLSGRLVNRYGVQSAHASRLGEEALRASKNIAPQVQNLHTMSNAINPEILKARDLAAKVKRYSGGNRFPGEAAAFDAKYRGINDRILGLQGQQRGFMDQAKLLGIQQEGLMKQHGKFRGLSRDSMFRQNAARSARDTTKTLGLTVGLGGLMGAGTLGAIHASNV